MTPEMTMKTLITAAAAAALLCACGGQPGQAQTNAAGGPVETRSPNGKDQ